MEVEPQGYYRRVPLPPHQLRERFTPTADAIVLCHLGVPRLDRENWSLTIGGLVEHSLTLRFVDLLQYAKLEITSIHQCAGSPLQPAEPTRRICNVTWGGARLADILADARPMPGAMFLWSYGADRGHFSDVEVDAYLKDVPLQRISADVMIAYEINGAPLPPEHGYPARLLVPGFYGTNSVKWVTRMVLADARAHGPFTTRWYNDPVLDSADQDTGRRTPVWSIAPESLIVSPAPDEILRVSEPAEIWGWTWADGGVTAVHVSADDGVTWGPAELEVSRDRQWQRFSMRWTPTRPGPVMLASRAVSRDGASQPTMNRRNSIHRVRVSVD